MALIMVADDNPTILDLLKDYLEGRGHQVVTVPDGLQAAEKAQDWRPNIIICDIQMPNVYGTTAYDILQRNPATAPIPVIFITGLDVQKVKRIVPQGPKVRLITKPIDLPTLDAAISELLPSSGAPPSS